LRFKNYKDINFIKKSNEFYFAGSKDKYLIPGETAYKWENLKMGEGKYKDVYVGINEMELFSEKVDLDNNSVEESVKLLYNGDVNLAVNEEKKLVVSNILEDWNSSQTTFTQKPKLLLQNVEDEKNKIIVIPIVWGNKEYGSSVQLWIYGFLNNKINDICYFDGLGGAEGEINPKISSKYVDKGKVNIEIKEPSFKEELSVDMDKLNKTADLKNIFTGINKMYMSTIISYNIKDYDKDGYSELMTERLIYLDYRHIPIATLKVYYNFKKGRVEAYKIGK